MYYLHDGKNAVGYNTLNEIDDFIESYIKSDYCRIGTTVNNLRFEIYQDQDDYIIRKEDWSGVDKIYKKIKEVRYKKSSTFEKVEE